MKENVLQRVGLLFLLPAFMFLFSCSPKTQIGEGLVVGSIKTEVGGEGKLCTNALDDLYNQIAVYIAQEAIRSDISEVKKNLKEKEIIDKSKLIIKETKEDYIPVYHYTLKDETLPSKIKKVVREMTRLGKIDALTFRSYGTGSASVELPESKRITIAREAAMIKARAKMQEILKNEFDGMDAGKIGVVVSQAEVIEETQKEEDGALFLTVVIEFKAPDLSEIEKLKK